MSATIDYGIKPALKFLMKSDRWNVLTVMILHTNIRNRCYMSMDTITEMATNGNRTKSNDAKKWLQAHGAFTLVPKSKRVDEEEKLTARQLVYQLTGNIVACSDPACDCGADNKAYPYLYFGKEYRLDGQTIPPEHRLDGQTIDRLNGQTLSITSEVLEESDAKASETSTRAINPVFEAVKTHIFRIDASDGNAKGGRIGPIAAWLQGKSDGLKRAGGKVGFISAPATPEQVQAFAAYWKLNNKTANMPLDLVKFVEAWRAWATQRKAAAARVTQLNATPAVPEITLTAAEIEARRQQLADARKVQSA